MEQSLNLAKVFVQRYRLAKVCACGKSNKDGKFVPDVNDPAFGFCHSCGQTFKPNKEQKIIERRPEKPKPQSFHPAELLLKSLKDYDKNNLITHISNLLGYDVTERAKKSGIGTSEHFNGGSTVFWQIDNFGKVHSGKIMKYDLATGKRIKEPFPHLNWMHKVLKDVNFELKQCLFGLHLLKDNSKPVAIVESEKTAFIMGLIDNSKVWLATAGKGNFKYEMLLPVKGQKIFAFPDNGEFSLWNTIAVRMRDYGFDITVIDVLETDKNPKGWDLADEVILQKMKQL